jgi:nitroimidazol reductase NimA-like FMN-containing flavoprotein (pyridoxamine 5'-phosphate oxidase superfamily)
VAVLISEMSGGECRDLLARLGFGRLACAHQNRPYIVPVYFAYEADHLYGFATWGQKVKWMRSNPVVCLEVDEVLSHFHWSSVVALGRYEELPDTPEYRGERLQAQLRLERRALWWQTAYAGSQARSDPHQPNAIFYCIHIDEITGRRATADPVESAVGLSRAESPAREE